MLVFQAQARGKGGELFRLWGPEALSQMILEIFIF